MVTPVKVKDEYGVAFKVETSDSITDAISQTYFDTEQERDMILAAILADADHDLWPDEANFVCKCTRPLYRLPVLGKDYGAGSISRKFGGRTPRGAYQYR